MKIAQKITFDYLALVLQYYLRHRHHAAVKLYLTMKLPCFFYPYLTPALCLSGIKTDRMSLNINTQALRRDCRWLSVIKPDFRPRKVHRHGRRTGETGAATVP